MHSKALVTYQKCMTFTKKINTFLRKNSYFWAVFGLIVENQMQNKNIMLLCVLWNRNIKKGKFSFMKNSILPPKTRKKTNFGPWGHAKDHKLREILRNFTFLVFYFFEYINASNKTGAREIWNGRLFPTPLENCRMRCILSAIFSLYVRPYFWKWRSPPRAPCLANRQKSTTLMEDLLGMISYQYENNFPKTVGDRFWKIV